MVVFCSLECIYVGLFKDVTTNLHENIQWFDGKVDLFVAI